MSARPKSTLISDLSTYVSDAAVLAGVGQRESDSELIAWAQYKDFSWTETCSKLVAETLGCVWPLLGGLFRQQANGENCMGPFIILPATARPLLEAGAMHARHSLKGHVRLPAKITEDDAERGGALRSETTMLVKEVVEVVSSGAFDATSKLAVEAQIAGDKQWSRTILSQIGLNSQILTGQSPEHYEADLVKRAFFSTYLVGFHYFLLRTSGI